MLFSSEDFISTDRYLQFSQSFPSDIVQYHKRDFIYSGGVWRGKYVAPISKTKCLLIGHSDYAFTEHDANVCKQTAPSIFAVNNESQYGKGLPIGITNNTNEYHTHPVLGNTDIMISELIQPQILSNKHLVYSNVSPNTHSSRAPILALFKDKTWVLNEEGQDYSLEGRINYLHHIRSHKFTLAPAGNGIDTHRLWEALYMQSIPIVKRHIVHRDWEDLPIYFVDNFAEVTPETLEQKYEELAPLFKDEKLMKKCTLGWWKENIQNCLKH